MSIDRVDLAKVNDDECKWTIVSGDKLTHHMSTTQADLYRCIKYGKWAFPEWFAKMWLDGG